LSKKIAGTPRFHKYNEMLPKLHLETYKRKSMNREIAFHGKNGIHSMNISM
jgi:hypothetical protein